MSDLLSSLAHRVLTVIREPRSARFFPELSLALFRAQWECNEAYRRFVEASGVSADDVRSWDQIPAVPTLAFKELELTALLPPRRTRVFHSSGTTGHRPSRHHHGEESLVLYEASLEAGFACGFWRTGPEVRPVGELANWLPVSLTPSATAAPHSSLVHMVDRLGARQDPAGTRFVGSVGRDGAWELDAERTRQILSECVTAQRPVVVFGTAFSFVHLIEAWDRDGVSLRLPAGSRILETGGYKGRTREWPKTELRLAITRILGVGLDSIVGEYGMSELSSQAYEEPIHPGKQADGGDRVSDHSVAARGVGGVATVEARGFMFPPWARPLVISPGTGKLAADGEVGLLRILDLANVWSVMAVQTEDRAVRRRDGVIDLLGRAAVSEPRGCSLMAV